jgi:hypothetical protein
MCSAQVCVLHSNFQQRDFIVHLEKGETMPNYRVLISDNGQFMRENECSDHGVFSDAEAAVTACKKIVDDDLKAMWKPGSTAAHLYTLFIAYGPSPVIVPINQNDPSPSFSAGDYAKKRCKDIVRLSR